MTNSLPLLLLGLGLSAAAVLLPQASAAPSSTPAPVPKGGMVFIANVGLEDLSNLSNVLRHAKLAKESGYLKDVVLIIYGRSIVLLDPELKSVPASLREELNAARAAGVRIVACGNSLEKYGIDPAALASPAEIVPAGIVEVARLVSEGYAVIRY